MEAASRSPEPSPEPFRRKREGAEREHEDLTEKVEKHHVRLTSLKRKYKNEQENADRRKTQIVQWETREKELIGVTQKDEREALELEGFISRLSGILFERQRDYEEMLIGDHDDSSGLAGIEKKLREDRRRLLRERQLLEQNWPRHETNEDETPSQESHSSTEGRDLDAMGSQWLRTINELLLSDVKWTEREAVGQALTTRTNQLEAAMRLLRMKKDPTMYTAFSQRDANVERQKAGQQTERDVKVPNFKGKLKEFIQREQAQNRAFLGDGNQDVDDSYWLHLEDVQRENLRRKQMVQQGEEWARERLAEELVAKMRIVEKGQREVESLESLGARLRNELQARKLEIREEERKKDLAERRRRQRRMDLEHSKKKAEHVRRQHVEDRHQRIAELREHRLAAEATRRQIRSDKTSAERELTDMKAALNALKVRAEDNTPELQKMADSWRDRVQELRELEGELGKMLDDAKRSNQEAKEQLAVVKPYQVEQQEMDYLVEQERQLDRQLREAHRQFEVDHSFPQNF